MARFPARSFWPQPETSRTAVEQTLAAFGIHGAERLRLHKLDVKLNNPVLAAQLRRALEALGPLFRCFGRYVSMRLDLINTHCWMELGEIEDWAEPAPLDDVSQWIKCELGTSPEALFVEFDETPLISGAAFQVHRARLKDERRVTVKVRRPNASQQLLGCVGLLRPLGGPLGIRDIDSVIAAFSDNLSRQFDLQNERHALESIAEADAQFEWMATATPVAELCTEGVLVIESLDGPTLADVLVFANSGDGDVVYCEGMRIDKADAARLLCTVWLRQAVFGQASAADPGACQIVFAHGRKLSVAGDAFTSIEAEQQTNLWRYLLATACDDPATACRSLMQEMTAPNRGAEGEMVQRFRQLVPFRDGGWSSGDEQLLTHEVFCHWYTASQMGFVPQRSLSEFYRGFARVAMYARKLAPAVDAMREATRELRLARSCAQLFGALEPDRAGDWMRQYAELALIMPKGMEDVLRYGSPSDRGGSFGGHGSTADERCQKSVVIVASLLAIFAAASLVARASGGAGSRSQGAAAAVMAIAGTLLLAAIKRM